MICLLAILSVIGLTSAQYTATFEGTCNGVDCGPCTFNDAPLNGSRNFMFIMVDQQRHSPVYEDPAVVAYLDALPGRKWIRDHAYRFMHHYVSTIACSPSRASIFTGHYPSLHGVAQTDGVGKSAEDENIHWLGEATVPSLARYLEAIGYNIHYKGKWHVSHRDIMIPGTGTSVLTIDSEGNPLPPAVKVYRRAEMLSIYGFNDWVGNEPHGSNAVNTGTIRDPTYAFDAYQLIAELDTKSDAEPFFLVVSFVNPHDIGVYPALGSFEAINASSLVIPNVPDPPTLNEDLSTKPRCQQSAQETWDVAIRVGPFQHGPDYTRAYYYFQTFVDNQINIVVFRMRFSRYYNNTMIIHFADHGEMLRAHGNMLQKWHQAYEEATHVDLYFANRFFSPQESPEGLYTTHIDLLPTLLGLAGKSCAEREVVRQQLATFHTEAQGLTGNDLSPLILGTGGNPFRCDGSTATTISLPNFAYFFTDDDIFRGDQQVALGYSPALQPNAYECLVGMMNGNRWKFIFYHDHNDVYTTGSTRVSELEQLQSQQANGTDTDFEMYDMTADPTETNNLMFGTMGNCSSIANTTVSSVCSQLSSMMIDRRRIHALVPLFQNQRRCGQFVC